MRVEVVLALLQAGVFLSHAAPFQNLGFDEANTNRVVPQSSSSFRGIGTTEDLLPGWQLSKGSEPQATLGLNLDLLGPGYATLISADQSDTYDFPVAGKYALYLVGSPGNQEPFSISQRGDIPADARVLTFNYSGYGFLAEVNGQNLRPTYLSGTMQAFDISSFQGQTVDLTLTALGPLMPTQSGSSYIDSIAFTVPEPSTVVLLAGGIIGLLWLQQLRGPRADQRSTRTSPAN
jgi:hypothetical protein